MSNKAIIEYKGVFYESDIYICTEEGKIFNSNTGREIVGSPDKDGYLLVCLQLHTESVRVEVQRRKHRVIAMSLLGIPEKERNIVNHKDGNKQNNHIENLEWVSARENTLHASRTGLIDGLLRTDVYCYDLSGNYINHYDSIRQAAEELKINRHGISRVLAGTQIQSENYFFSYDIIEDKSFFNKFDNNKFILLDYSLNILGEFSSFREMEKVVPVSRVTLKRYYDINKNKEKDFVFPTRDAQRFIALDKGKI